MSQPLSSSSAIGTPLLPIRLGYVKEALALICAGAADLQQRGVVTPTTHENDITYLLVDEMDAAQHRGIGQALTFESRANTPADPDDPLVRGEIDIKFRWSEYPPRYGRYLAVEAKLLRGSGATLAGAYVTDGVVDFVSAKYSRHHDFGIMLGYVIVPPVTNAVAKVGRAMRKRSSLTQERAEFAPNGSLCSHPHTHHSAHVQAQSLTLITLVHVFLKLC